MTYISEDSTSPSEPQAKIKRKPAPRGPATNCAFLTSTHFEKIAARVASVRKQMQGRAMSREELSDNWGYKGGGNVNEMLRGIVDFGLFEFEGSKRNAKFKLTQLGLELSLATKDSPEWNALAAQSIRSTEIGKELFNRFGTEITQLQLEIFCHRLPVKQWNVKQFIPCFLKCAEIVRRAENPAPVIAPSTEDELKAKIAELQKIVDEQNSKAASASAAID